MICCSSLGPEAVCPACLPVCLLICLLSTVNSLDITEYTSSVTM